MQTNFTADQLTDPGQREAEKILRTCVHCGFCTATCPTYLIKGDELDSPRGRIYLIKDMLENDKPANTQVVTHIDRCLSCLSCMTTCPSGVHYMHLVDHARAHIEKTYERPVSERLMRWFLATVLPRPALLRPALALGRMARPLRPLMKFLPQGDRLAAMLDLAQAKPRKPNTITPVRPVHPQGRVAILKGCAGDVMGPQINEAAIRFLNRHGYEVADTRGETCCGSLVHHMGREHEALENARRNIDVWTELMDKDGLDAILITASGCGTTIKDYGYMLREDPVYADKAARVSALAKDIAEFLTGIEFDAKDSNGLTVAYHSACSMQHGQQIKDQPKNLLEKAGFRVKDVPEGHICCGSAGTYNVMQPEIATQLRERKIKNIARTSPDVIATGNIGCITQIAGGTDIPIVHTIELLDWATGGPKPVELDVKR